jgi:hypothetical protein
MAVTSLREAYRTGLLCRAVCQADPGNADWRCALSISHGKIGDVLLAQDDAEARCYTGRSPSLDLAKERLPVPSVS